jgi:spermidine synthase
MSSPQRTYRLEIFLVSMAAILLEISYTRIFSYKLFYYFTYLTIGIVLLGLGSGGVLVAVIPRLRRVPTQRLVALCALATSIAIPVGYVLVATTQLNASDIADSVVEAATLVWICSLLFTPFLLVGLILAAVFGARSEDFSHLYFADLVGAALGCAACIPLFGLISPPGCIMLSAAVMATAALHLALGESRRGATVAGAVLLALVPAIVFPRFLPDPVPDRAKTMSPQRGAGWKTLFSSWSTVFRIDVVDGMEPESRYLINHDGNMGSNVIRFNGDFRSLERFNIDVRSVPFSVIKPNPRVLIIGAAGGHEILASLYFGAEHVTAVELNPVTVSLLTDHFADYTGRIAEHERVTLVNAEGRAFVNRNREKFDLIWFVAPDSYAAMNAASSGAFVLSESYLYTQEMITESLAHLADGGVVCLQTGDIDFARKPNRAVRYLATARQAFESIGVGDFPFHVLVSSTPEMFTLVTILLSRQPFSAQQAERFHANAAVVRPVGKGSTVWHPLVSTGSPVPNHPVAQVVNVPDDGLSAWLESYPYNVTPVTDDIPFFWHFAGFRKAILSPLDTGDVIFDPEDAKGERVLGALLLFAAAYSAVFLLVPLLAVRQTWRQVPYKLQAGIYFAALGLGFMFFEICMIQKLTLFLGYPTHSLTVTLFAILIFSGIGSLLSSRYAEQRTAALRTLLACLIGLVVVYQIGMTPLVRTFGGASLEVRIALAIAVLAPLGLCLGAFMPIGIATVSRLTPYREEYVAWGWAVNGFFSVMSSVLATMLAMTYGFTVVLYTALAIYVVGIAALSRIPQSAANAYVRSA